jgi:hypothetical protein
MKRTLWLAASLLLVSGSAVAQEGEVFTWKSSAKFTDVAVFGPKLAVYRRTDGSWAGTFNGLPLEVTSYKDWLVGLDMVLRVIRTPEMLILDGTFRGKFVHFEWPTDPDQIVQHWERRYGATFGYLHATGSAIDRHPPLPQLALALLAVG